MEILDITIQLPDRASIEMFGLQVRKLRHKITGADLYMLENLFNEVLEVTDKKLEELNG